MFVVLLLEIKVKHKSSQKDIIRTRIIWTSECLHLKALQCLQKKKQKKTENYEE